jgi:hypothetical protein
MQQQAELLGRRVATEPGDEAKIKKLYKLVFAREASADELGAGLAYLAAEPLKEYEERKLEREKAAAEAAADPLKAKLVAAAKAEAAAKEAEAEGDMPATPEPPGMMAGLKPDDAKSKKQQPLPTTVLGRYAKVLLSSNEFLFVR